MYHPNGAPGSDTKQTISLGYDTSDSYIWSIDTDTIETSSSDIEKVNAQIENNYKVDYNRFKNNDK